MDRKVKVVVGGVGIVVLLAVLATTTMGSATQFVTPTDLAETDDHDDSVVKLEGQAVAVDDGDPITFDVADGNDTKPVTYDGEMPETMSDGRVVVAEGHFDGEELAADDLTVRAHEGEHPEDHPATDTNETLDHHESHDTADAEKSDDEQYDGNESNYGDGLL
ncbi:cytochrome c maturation protein CcmE domain-containing protein [Natronobacterium gregoryi]|uniref:Cytochrome C biogenesis protein n=2 Tax=Natronobacterium gregoryi TaxID=44930 RepID=L0ALD6_NATGS|nr:cytochrome c maturation protein CcmE [Natronobacterium gregoryi]AFZ74264.1 cytochrome c-type biogenesis protein CcmE [Natronobacterium gregoryi SP2]ELY63722.1 cytochrome c-type biogenesis protein [Natronobacterium gregoryi SP2]PLK21953.1 cytochrome C biogenesis protein [Natronobacterium gregoryi SP2]SFI52608.1 cytochrome c-type biogenesis protein CcmE [Natronobacterium gregoryi]